MTFEDILDQAIAMLQRRGRVSYRAFLTFPFHALSMYSCDILLSTP